LVIEYEPAEFVIAVRENPVPRETAVTVAPGTIAPVGSLTIPFKPLLPTCATADGIRKAMLKLIARRTTE